MATNPATTTDLIARSLRTLTAQEISVGEVLLEDAWNILLATVPSVGTRLDVVPLDTIFEALVVQVQCAMVLRVLTNPDGKLEEHGDDYSYRIDSARSTGALYLSLAELDLLGIGDDTGGDAFTIKPAGLTPGTPNELTYQAEWYTL
jgi:hypothetical protein